jgi:D-glycero-D-manno-heptose 1,7-bisphosphate phosphatase
MKPAVFLDRDGTLIEDVGFLDAISRVAFYPWTIDSIRALNRAGLVVVVVTNQSGIARGILDEALVDATHAHLTARLAAGGARVDAYYYCPHHPRGTVPQFARECDCRKPARGLIDRAVTDLGLDPARSFVVGDKWIDVQLGRAVGARAILVRTGAGASEERRPPDGVSADVIVDNLAAAASWILSRHQSAISDQQSATRRAPSAVRPSNVAGRPEPGDGRDPQC